MICPHCGIGVAPSFENKTGGSEEDRRLTTSTGNCTECGDLIILARWIGDEDSLYRTISDDFLIYPPEPLPRPIPPEVTGEYAQDFREACLVLGASPKASAALSRRLLQHIIREKAGIRRRNLDEEINDVIAQGNVSSSLADDLDMIRTIGNFAAHPIKSTNTGEVVEVEPGEAEALLDLLEQLFDHYFVRPAKRAAMQAQINQKLADAGKPPLKGTTLPPLSQASETPAASPESPGSPPAAPPVLS